jgi:ketosteroid isomerase-like protein
MMKFAYRWGTSLLVIAAASTLALGQTPGHMGGNMQGKTPGKMTGGMMSRDEAAKTIAVMDHIWLDAAHNRDTETMAWLFADDFVEIHPGGDIVDGPEQIAQIQDTTRQIEEIHPDDIHVLYVTADTAILLDTTTIRGLSGGVKYDGKYKVIRVFVKRQGRWRAIGAGIAPIMP